MTRLGEGRPATGGVRALLALVIGLGILIVAGVLLVMVTLIHRALLPHRLLAASTATSPDAVAAVLEQPAGTRIVSVTAADGGDLLALLVSGGGLPDRVLLLDPREDGRLVGTIRLSGGTSSPAPQ